MVAAEGVHSGTPVGPPDTSLRRLATGGRHPGNVLRPTLRSTPTAAKGETMTNRFEPRGSDTPIRPIGSAEEADLGMDDEDENERLDDLPEHERDEDRTIGGGVMDAGGTAIDRGTGTLGGQAQRADQSGFGAGDARDGRTLDEATDDALGHDERDH